MKKLLAIASTVLVGASSCSVFASTPSQDVLTWAYNNGITKYNTAAEFRGDMTVTREQAAKMIVTWIQSHHELGFSMSDDTSACNFNDAASIDSTLSYSVESACAYGLFKGYKGNFMPKDYITYDHVRTLLARAIALMPKYAAYENDLSVSWQGPVQRGDLLKGLYHIDAIVTAQIADDKEKDLVTAQTELNAAMAKWDAKDAGEYTVRQQLSCFCTPNSTHPISFTVKNGAVVSGSVMDVNETDKIPTAELTSSPKTVAQAFEMIQDAIDRKADKITIVYDATWGYPKNISIDYSTMMADEEMYYTFELSNVK